MFYVCQRSGIGRSFDIQIPIQRKEKAKSWSIWLELEPNHATMYTKSFITKLSKINLTDSNDRET